MRPVRGIITVVARSSRSRLLVALLAVVCSSSGCLARKAIALPLRVTGAAVSVVPVVGGATHAVMDGAAEAVD